MFAALLGPVSELAKTIVGGFIDSAKAKRKLKAAKQETELKIEYAKATADINWDSQAMLNAQNSWKDEWFTILLSIPAILCFIKFSFFDGPGIVADGFAALSGAPEWYLGAFGLAVAASFGMRSYAKKMIGKVKG
jgi:hypothetical protein